MRLGTLRGFAFDLDGCIWAGPTLLAGAAELVRGLREAGCRVVYVTNSSRERAAAISGKLTRLGIPTPPDDVLPALDLLGETIHRRMGPARVLALGTDQLRQVLETAGHTVVPIDAWPNATAVAVGFDPAFDFARLRAASRAVAAGAAFFTVNLDARLPVAPGEFDPGCGAMAEAVAAAGGARPVVVGKPHRPIFEIALERMGCRPAEAAMVGDSLETDVVGGRGAGMFTIWVEPAGNDHGEGRADLVIRSLAELGELWRKSRGRLI
jgi:HAD superfamily hydrolase (TIGR01450 family)